MDSSMEEFISGYENFGIENIENIDFSFLGVAVGVVLIIIGFFLFIGLILKILEIVGFWKIFKKANKPGWASIVPFYNTYVKCEVGGTAWWWILLVYVTNIIGILGAPVSGGLSYVLSIVTLFSKFNINYNICKKFGKDFGYAIILTLFPFIGALILGGKKYNYDESITTSSNGVFGS